MTETPKAIAFSSRVRSAATTLEIAYRLAKRVSEEWYALSMSTDIPFDVELFDDGHTSRPITHDNVYDIITRCNDLIADYEAIDKAKLNTIIKASDAPLDWR